MQATENQQSIHDEPTNHDILEAISAFSSHVDQRFEKLESDVGALKSDVQSLKSDMHLVKSTMVTKNYLDEKLSDLRGDITILIRKEDTKVKALVDILCERKILSDEDKHRIFSMEPFAQMGM